MPIISLTQEAMDRGKRPEIGWSPAELSDVTEFEAQNKESMNWLFEFRCMGGPEKATTNNGRYISILFNAKAIGVIGKGIPEAIKDFQKMIAALLGIAYREVSPDNYDTDKLLGKACWIKIGAGTDRDGKLTLSITDFSTSNDVPF